MDMLRDRLSESRFDFQYRCLREKAQIVQNNVEPVVSSMKLYTKNCLQLTEELVQIILALDALEPGEELHFQKRKQLIQSIQEAIGQLDDTKEHVTSTFNFEKEMLKESDLESSNNNDKQIVALEPVAIQMEITTPEEDALIEKRIVARNRRRASTITNIHADQNKMQQRIYALQAELDQAIANGQEDEAGEIGLKVARLRASLVKLQKQQQHQHQNQQQ